MDELTVKQELITAFEYAHAHDDWVHPLDEVLGGVSAVEALWRSAPNAKGIWDIVLHVAVWNENIVERMRTGQKARPAEGDWPPPPAEPSTEAWEAAKHRLAASLTDIRAYMEAHTLDELAAGPYGLADLLCRFTHVAYHLGQIVRLRELRGF